MGEYYCIRNVEEIIKNNKKFERQGKNGETKKKTIKTINIY